MLVIPSFVIVSAIGLLRIESPRYTLLAIDATVNAFTSLSGAGDRQCPHRCDADQQALLVMPTGSGKTVVFSEICRLAREKKRKVLILFTDENS